MTKKTDTPLFDEKRYKEIIAGLEKAIADAKKIGNEPARKSAIQVIKDTSTSTILPHLKKVKPRYKRKGA